MKLGLIGHPLGHSWSPVIHAFMIHEDYQKWDLQEEELDAFMKRHDFDGINVTIPYKQKVIPYLDELDPAAEAIGAVNCIVNHSGRLTGYNTDCLGFAGMVQAGQIDFKGKKTALLGTGGASKAVGYALHQMGADVQLVSRREKPDCITYERLEETAEQYQCIVNVTPVGMYPHTEEAPIELARFTKAEAVVDVVANPLRTKLMFDAKMHGIQYMGGFEMLVRQAFAADELFTGKKLDPALNQACMNMLYHQKRNIVLIGMPTSGKSTLSRMIGHKTSRRVIEMDDEIVKKLGTSIKECFAQKGEQYFREVERETAEELKNQEGVIISCGGGVVTNESTMRALSENGIVIWIQRNLSHLFATDSRPLTGNEEYMKKLYQMREPLYRKYSDAVIDNDRSLEEAADLILKAAGEE